jgi:hypothetical protein
MPNDENDIFDDEPSLEDLLDAGLISEDLYDDLTYEDSLDEEND